MVLAAARVRQAAAVPAAPAEGGLWAAAERARPGRGRRRGPRIPRGVAAARFVRNRAGGPRSLPWPRRSFVFRGGVALRRTRSEAGPESGLAAARIHGVGT